LALSDAEVFIAGLPGAGKTTFLAALWHLVRSDEVPPELAFDGLEGIDVAHLNKIRLCWQQHMPMPRTKPSQERIARINLKSKSGDRLTLAAPDFAGEGFRQMWTARRATKPIAQSARDATGHLLLINAEKVVYPLTVDDYRVQLEAMSATASAEMPFDAKKCPTAAMLADVLCSLEEPPVSAAPKRMMLALTAWDTVAHEGRSPDEVLAANLPLVRQMMRSRERDFQWRVVGVSAQGGDYDDFDPNKAPDIASERIKVVENSGEHHDLTRMLSWLLE
jgi:hypothetical protein